MKPKYHIGKLGIIGSILLLVTLCFYVAVTVPQRTTTANIYLLSLLVLLSALTKVSTPFYLGGAVLLFFWQNKTVGPKDSFIHLQGRYKILLLFIILSFIMLLIFMKLNLQAIIHLRMNSLFDPYWGSNKSFAFKTIYWLRALS